MNLQAQMGVFVDLVNQPGITLEMVLDHPSTAICVRNGFRGAIDFFANDDHLSRILDYVFTNEMPNTSNPQKTIRACLQFVTTANKMVLTFLLASPDFIDRIEGFSTSIFNKDPAVCGRFQQVFEAVTRSSFGEFIKERPNMAKFCVLNMYTVGIRDLFANLIIEYSDHLNLEPSDIVEGLQKASGTELYYLFSALKVVFKQFPNYCKKLLTIDVAKAVLMAAPKSNKASYGYIAYEVLEAVLDKVEEIGDVHKFINTYQETISIDHTMNPGYLAGVLKIFKTTNSRILIKIFDENCLSSLSKGIISSLKKMEKGLFAKFVEENQVLERIQKDFGNYIHNPFILDLSSLINEKLVSPPQEWKQFYDNCIVVREKKMIEPYGYPQPSSKSQ